MMFICYVLQMDTLCRDHSPWYSKELHSLGREPQAYACYSQCSVNGVRFVVHDSDENKRTQNSGVMVEDGDLSYYGIINNIIELRYANGMPVVVFKCTWYNTDPSDRGSTKRDYGLLSVDTSTSWFKNWPYCLATTARQVYYLEDLKAGETWKVVNIVSHRGVYSESSLAINEEVEDDNPYQEEMPNVIPCHLSHGDGGEGNNQMPKARRKLYLDDDDDDMSESEKEDHEGQSDGEPEFEDPTDFDEEDDV